MSDRTAIEWAAGDDGTPGASWNPTRGCSRVSEGCRHCYAERVAARFSGLGQPYEGFAEPRLHVANADEPDRDNRMLPRWTGVVRLVPEMLDAPLRWRKPRRVFVDSMSDLFHEGLPDG